MIPTSIPESTDDGSESYDDDLDWILEKLTDRAGGDFGLIFRYLEGVNTPALMARTWKSAALPETAVAEIAGHLRGVQELSSACDSQDLVASSTVQLRGPEHSGSIRLLHMRFHPAAGVDIVATVGRPDLSAVLLQRLVAGRLQPVLARYIRLWWMHRTERRRALAFECAIDEVELGIVLLDRRGQLLYENAYARRILDGGDGIRRAGRCLASTDPNDALRLQTAFQNAVMGNLVADAAASWPAPLVLLHRGDGRRALILTVMAHRRRAVDPDDAAVIVHVLHPERDMGKSLVPACRIYGLTPAESRLVVELVNGANLQQIAMSMNVSVATVRSQLKHVFDKTGTCRQAELIRVMLASAVRSTNIDLALT